MFKFSGRKFQTCIAIALAIVLGLPPAALATAFNLGAFWKKKVAAIVSSGWTQIPGGELNLNFGLGGTSISTTRVLWTGSQFVVVQSSYGMDDDGGGGGGLEVGTPQGGTNLKFFDDSSKTWTTKEHASYSYIDFSFILEIFAGGLMGLFGLGTFPPVVVGSKIVFWGITYPSNGYVYDMTNDSWYLIDVSNMPELNFNFGLGYSAVAAGSEVIYWGGGDFYSRYNTGLRYNPTTNSLQSTSTVNAPVGRLGHTAVWTGSTMIIWGGFTPITTPINTGGRYNPTTDSWTSTSTTGAPEARGGHTAVWTGTRMLIWGGKGNSGVLNTGGIYDPGANSWSSITTSGAPTARRSHSACWTGSKMVIWGGFSEEGDYIADGKLYDPSTNTWSPMADAPATFYQGFQLSLLYPTIACSGSKVFVWNGFEWGSGIYDLNTNSWEVLGISGMRPRFFDDGFGAQRPLGVWAGSRLVTWGGFDMGGLSNRGDRFDPISKEWSEMTLVGAPEARDHHSMVSTGSKVLVWGGETDEGDYFNTGGIYDVASDSWTSISTTNAPSARSYHAAAWTGSKMFIWGGAYNGTSLANGGLYDLATNSWTSVSNTGAPSARYNAHAFWTGSKIIVWGGIDDGGNALASGAMYDPSSNSWTTISGTGAPNPRYWSTVTWTGTHLVVWGGSLTSQDESPLNSGARYNPQTNTWSPITTTGAPTARLRHTAVNMNGKVVIWGGDAGSYETAFDSGAIYDPVADSWTPLTQINAPRARTMHGAVWTGTQMIIWGGFGSEALIFLDGGMWAP